MLHIAYQDHLVAVREKKKHVPIISPNKVELLEKNSCVFLGKVVLGPDSKRKILSARLIKI